MSDTVKSLEFKQDATLNDYVKWKILDHNTGRTQGHSTDGKYRAELFCSPGGAGFVGLLYVEDEPLPRLSLSCSGPSAHAMQYAFAFAIDRMRSTR